MDVTGIVNNQNVTALKLFNLVEFQNMNINLYYNEICGNKTYGFFLTQILFLYRGNEFKPFYKKDSFFYNYYKFTKSEVKLAKKRLTELRLLTIKTAGFPSRSHYFPNIELIHSLCEALKVKWDTFQKTDENPLPAHFDRLFSTQALKPEIGPHDTSNLDIGHEIGCDEDEQTCTPLDEPNIPDCHNVTKWSVTMCQSGEILPQNVGELITQLSQCDHQFVTMCQTVPLINNIFKTNQQDQDQDQQARDERAHISTQQPVISYPDQNLPATITHRTRTISGEVDPYPADFGLWWDLYPLKKAKSIAAIAFKKATLGIRSGYPLDTLLEALKSQIEERRFLDENNAFVPEWPHPTTWLNQKRWEDVVRSQDEIRDSKPKGKQTRQEKQQDAGKMRDEFQKQLWANVEAKRNKGVK